MSKVYSRKFVEADSTQLYLPAGELNQCWAVGFPPSGAITRLIVRQSAGTAVAFTLNLLDRAACDVGSGESVSIESADPVTRSMAAIIPEQSVTSGSELALRAGVADGGPWTYQNREGSFSVPVRAIYLHVVVAANADGKEFEVTIEGFGSGEVN